jgi:DNA-binding MarR family transcriptional regulator
MMIAMTDDQTAKVRNLRDGGWYWIDSKVLRLYGRRLGTSGIAIYNALACFADSKTQKCFPTRKALAQILGMSRRTVTRKIKLLEEFGLVRVDKARSSYRYLLLKLPAEAIEETRGGDKKDTSKATAGNTNNNQLSRSINNIDIEDKYFPSAYKSFRPDTREKLLALDLAQALDDRRNLLFYISCARRYPESSLRRVLGEVKEIPQESIKKGRAALFNYLVQKYAKEQRHNLGH